jgi:hypothetical protein
MQIKKWQSTLMRLINSAEATVIRDSLKGKDKADFIGYSTAESSAWIDASGGRMSDEDFDICYQMRLGLPQFAEGDKCKHCGVEIGLHGQHAFSCIHLQKSRTTRHTAVQDGFCAVTSGLKELGIRQTKNKSMNEWYSHTQLGLTAGGRYAKGVPTDFKMDVGFQDTNVGTSEKFIVDFVITSATEEHQELRAAAREKEKVKEKKYLDNYEIAQPDKYFVPFAMETNGAWGPRAHKFVDGQLVEWKMKYSGSIYVEAGITFKRKLWEHVGIGLMSANASTIRLMRANTLRDPKPVVTRRPATGGRALVDDDD